MRNRPSSEEELQRREATGVIRASRFVRRFARSHEPITMSTIQSIHREIFRDAWPEIAGIYRNENLEITDSRHKPPHFSEVSVSMQAKETELLTKLGTLTHAEGSMLDWNDSSEEMLDRIIETAAWLHHLITYIHPFREGNGRTARLAANLILERYGLIGISVKVEQENKNQYRAALAQADAMNDYEPLMNLIYDGLIERYNGSALIFYTGTGKS